MVIVSPLHAALPAIAGMEAPSPARTGSDFATLLLASSGPLPTKGGEGAPPLALPSSGGLSGAADASTVDVRAELPVDGTGMEPPNQPVTRGEPPPPAAPLPPAKMFSPAPTTEGAAGIPATIADLDASEDGSENTAADMPGPPDRISAGESAVSWVAPPAIAAVAPRSSPAPDDAPAAGPDRVAGGAAPHLRTPAQGFAPQEHSPGTADASDASATGVAEPTPPALSATIATIMAQLSPMAAPGATPSAAPLPLPVDAQDRWIERLASEIGSMTTGGVARFALSPDHLGQISVELLSGEGGTHVHIRAEEPAAQALLSGANDRLEQEARARGVRLVEVSVDGSAARSTGSDHTDRHPPPAPAARSFAPKRGEVADSANHATAIRSGRWA